MSDRGGSPRELLGLVTGGAALLGAFLLIGLTEQRALGIALGILAVVLAKSLYMKSPGDSDGDDQH